jgi:AcrR family transcriptional regulator
MGAKWERNGSETGASIQLDDPEMTTQPPITTAPQSAQKRTRLAREKRIQHILDVSQRLFSTHAYDAIAIEDLATAAGMAKGLLYHYFASKRELYLATLRHVQAQILQFANLHPDLHAGLSQTVSLFEQYPGLAKMVLRAGIGSDAEVDALTAEYRQQQLSRVYHSLGFSGGLPDAHPLVLLGLRGWLSLLEEVCLQWALQSDVTRDEVVCLLEQSLHAILSSTVSPDEQAHLALITLGGPVGGPDGAGKKNPRRKETKESA